MTHPPLVEVLVFEVGVQRYGIPVETVREVLPAMTLSPLSASLPDLKGILNLRGQVVPVLDIRGPFQLPAKVVQYSDHLIVCQAGIRLVALLADRAVDLVHLDPDQIELAESLASAASLLSRVAKVPDGLILILDPQRLWGQIEQTATHDVAELKTSSRPRQPAERPEIGARWSERLP